VVRPSRRSRSPGEVVAASDVLAPLARPTSLHTFDFYAGTLRHCTDLDHTSYYYILQERLFMWHATCFVFSLVHMIPAFCTCVGLHAGDACMHVMKTILHFIKTRQILYWVRDEKYKPVRQLNRYKGLYGMAPSSCMYPSLSRTSWRSFRHHDVAGGQEGRRSI